MALAPIAKAAAAATASLLGATWLNDKYAVTSDLSQILGMRHGRKYYQHMLHEHGDSDWSFYHVLHCTYGTNDYAQAFVFEDRSWTYGELRGEIGRLAERLKEMGIGNRTVVGMYVNNSPEFIVLWFALYKVGAIPAPVNTAVTRGPFTHCLRISGAEAFVTSYDLWDKACESLGLGKGEGGVKEVLPKMKTVAVYDYGTYPRAMARMPQQRADMVIVQSELPEVTPQMGDFSKDTRPHIRADDTSCYLFTSGTTGFPKAAVWPAAYSLMSTAPRKWPYMYEVPRRMYICMPMFHGSAAFACLPSTFATSGTVILARRFSVSRFWADCRRSNADSFLYIGEMVRYLVQAPPDPHFPDPKKMHNIKVCYGLGLSPPAWRALREKFGVPWIIEYYSASEATAAICHSNKPGNDEGVGHIARWGPLMRSSWFGQDSLYIIRTDAETGEPIRNMKGLCEQVGFDEKGEAIARIEPPLRRKHDYVGEGGAEATEKKMLRNVFKHGDTFMRTGDAISINRRGYLTFHDRLGDTYRAKGHNISTTEVEAAISSHPGILSANVYAIPMNKYGYEGQLGCAAINLREGASPSATSLHETETIENLEKWLVEKGGLPAYGVPRFLRVIVDSSGEGEGGGAARDEGARKGEVPGGERVSIIMKKLKTGRRMEGFDVPGDCGDRMYFIEREGRGFRILDGGVKAGLLGGRARI